MTGDAQAQLEGFIDRFTPQVAADARVALAWMEARLPGAIRLVYDNYNALAIGFSSNAKLSGTFASIALYPRWVSLFLMRGVELPDPAGLLEGGGGRIRHVKLKDIGRLSDAAVAVLLDAAAAIAEPPLDRDGVGTLVIKSVSPNQRPRRV